MNEYYYKYKNEKDRMSCIFFLKHSSFWNSIEIISSKSNTNRITICLDESEFEEFYSQSCFKGFKFYEL